MTDVSLPITILFIDPLPSNSPDIIISLNNSITFNVNSKGKVQGIINFPINKFNLLTIRNSDDENAKFGNYGYIFNSIKYAKLVYNENMEIYSIEELVELPKIYFRYTQTMFQMLDYNNDLQHSQLKEWDFLTSSLNSLDLSVFKKIITATSPINAIYVDTHMISNQDQELLKPENVTKDVYSNNSEVVSLNLTNINFKSKEAIRKGYEMEDFMDSANYLRTIISNKKTFNLLQETALSFILGFSMANYSCFMQWHRLLELIFKCNDKVEVIEYLQKCNAIDETNLNYKKNYLAQFYDLIFRQWNLLDWEYKVYFINVSKWGFFLQKIEFSAVNMEIYDDDDDDNNNEARDLMIFKIKKQLESLQKEDEEDPFKDENKKATVEEILSEKEEEENFDKEDVLNIYDTNNEDNENYVELYGSSEDEFEPAVVSNITYKKTNILDIKK
ncbi:hypothetical protein HANVADRAFT_50924 [Hanseniaspora valbyensis NRRL Y-1626]|uniref:AAR2 C-terminal domain-containing protein n=1 Tax=Hanseniaspora valbyensis NRRL Y-1626 TaxID=766949 RepID=A0A1B7TJP4_9ASCO|nr:hypothetical protein HANVADRAFT_50924 [Hanseniaspora valbyensis NRRL Y-1626]